MSGHKTLTKRTQSLLYIETKGNSDKSAKEGEFWAYLIAPGIKGQYFSFWTVLVSFSWLLLGYLASSIMCSADSPSCRQEGRWGWFRGHSCHRWGRCKQKSSHMGESFPSNLISIFCRHILAVAGVRWPDVVPTLFLDF